MVNLLLSYNASVDLAAKNGLTAMHLCAQVAGSTPETGEPHLRFPSDAFPFHRAGASLVARA